MDEVGGWLIGFVIVIGIVIFVLGLVFTGVLFIGANLIVLVDSLMSIWGVIPPALSWTLNGFALGTMVHYGFLEYRGLPAATEKVLWAGLGTIAAAFVAAVALARLAAHLI